MDSSISTPALPSAPTLPPPNPNNSVRQCTVEPPENPFPVKPIVSTILSEEDYVEAVGTIIERDYFPDLKRLRATVGLRGAQDANDFVAAKRFRSELADLRCTPASGSLSVGSPMSSWSVALPLDQRQFVRCPDGQWRRVNTDIRLDTFHARYTSEDNASFEGIIAHEKDLRRVKEAWIEEKEREHNERVAVTKALTDETGIVIPESLQHVEPMQVAGNKYKARSMFHWHQIETLEQGGKLQHHPVVRFKNTRFPTRDQNKDHPEAMKKREQLFAEQQREEVYNAALFKGEFGNVSEDLLKTPNIEPGVGASPLMTYGKIASTPRMVEQSLDSFQFEMQEPRLRDVLATKLQREAKSKVRDAQRRTTSSRLKKFGITPRTHGSCTSAASSVDSRHVPASSAIGVLLRKCERAAKMMASSRSVTRSTPGSRTLDQSGRTPLSTTGIRTPRTRKTTQSKRI